MMGRQRLSGDGGETVPHMLLQFDLVTHDLERTRGVTRNWSVHLFHHVVTIRADEH